MKNHKTLCRLGMTFLILAFLWQRFGTGLGEDLGDGLMGLLFGLSIGFNLWAVSVKSRRLSC
jgi:tetrahydromethanopterin S-methyltransferase subunit G